MVNADMSTATTLGHRHCPPWPPPRTVRPVSCSRAHLTHFWTSWTFLGLTMAAGRWRRASRFLIGLSPSTSGTSAFSFHKVVALMVNATIISGALNESWLGWVSSRRDRARHTLRHSALVASSPHRIVKPAIKGAKQSSTSSSSSTRTTPAGKEAVRWHTKPSRSRAPSRWKTTTIPFSGLMTRNARAFSMTLRFGLMPYMLWQNRTTSYFSRPPIVLVPILGSVSRPNGVRRMSGGLSRQGNGDSSLEVEESHFSRPVENKLLGSNATYLLILRLIGKGRCPRTLSGPGPISSTATWFRDSNMGPRTSVSRGMIKSWYFTHAEPRRRESKAALCCSISQWLSGRRRGRGLVAESPLEGVEGSHLRSM